MGGKHSGGGPGRIGRVVKRLFGVVRNLTVAEVAAGLADTIEVVRFEEYEESVTDMFPNKGHRERFDHNVDVELGRNPEGGSTIANTNNWRKMRVSRPDQQKGERGGARVIYFYAPEIRCAFLALAYAKNEADDISSAGKKWLRELAADCETYRPKRG